MENIMIDTCVYFKMIPYNNFVMKYGKENLDKFIEHNKQKHINNKNEIDSFISKDRPNFFNENKNLEYNDIIVKYSKERITNEVSRLGKKIAGWESLQNNPNVPDEKKKILFQAIEQINKEIERYNAIDEKINNYKIEKQGIDCGEMYKKAVNDEIKLFTNTVSYSEVLEHSKMQDKTNWVYYPMEEILNMSKNMVSVVTTKSRQPFLKDEEKDFDKTLQMIEFLAKRYRRKTSNENESGMGKDINTLGDYGDSKIAAFASMSGMTFVTINGKDFVFNKDRGYDNEEIRNRINRINKTCPYATDAQPITVEEFLSGDYKRPTKSNPMFKLSKTQKRKQDQRFVEEYEMQMQ